VSASRKRLFIAATVGIVVAAIAVTIAIAASHTSAHTSVSIQSSAPPPAAAGSGGGVQGRPSGGFGGGGGGRFGGGFGAFGGGDSAAAAYLGISASTLQTDLAGGKTLAEVAKAQGKTVDGLVSAMVAATRKQLDAAVASGRFTKQQEATIVAGLQQRDTAMVNGTRTGRGGFGGGGFGGGQGRGGSGSFGGTTGTA
jgi:hypothetical protein